jgi:uncharacterized FAD-dependent dehydrogenase
MCPGGKVVAATSEEGRVVTNGMSQYSRAEFNANSGLVVTVDPERDYPGSPLAGIAFQRHWEELAFKAGGGDYCAPGQKVGDFLAGRPLRANLARWCLPTSRACGLPIWRNACRPSCWRRSARRCRCLAARSRAMITPMW